MGRFLNRATRKLLCAETMGVGERTLLMVVCVLERTKSALFGTKSAICDTVNA